MKNIFISMNSKCHAETHYFVTKGKQAQDLLHFEDILIPSSIIKSIDGIEVNAKEVCKNSKYLKRRLNIKQDDILIVIVEGNLYDNQNDEYFCVCNSEYFEEPDMPGDFAIFSLYFLREQSSFMTERRPEWDHLDIFEQKRLLSELILYLVLGLSASLLTGMGFHEDLIGCVMDYCQTPTDIYESINKNFHFCSDCEHKLNETLEGKAVMAIAQYLRYNPYHSNIYPINTRIVNLVSSIQNNRLRYGIQRALKFFDIDYIDICLLMLSKEFEASLKTYIRRTSNYGRYTLEEMVNIVSDRGVITAAQSFIL